MKTAQKLLEIESLTENLAKKSAESGLLRHKVLYFISQYENLSVSMIIEKLGIKKSNFALMTAELERDGFINIHKAEIDKRCRTLSLTEKGRAELNRYINDLQTLCKNTSIDVDNALDILIKYLNKIV